MTGDSKHGHATGQVAAYPLLAAIFPIISLYSANVGKVVFTDIGIPLLLATLVTAALYTVLRSFLRDPHRRALEMFVLIVLFYSYGFGVDHLRRAITSGGIRLVGTGVAAFSLLLAFGMLTRWLRKSGPSLSALTRVLNTCTGLAVAIAICTAAYAGLTLPQQAPRAPVPGLTPPETAEALPNIYYVIVDGYGREDVLRNLYDHDNSEFVGFLRDRGFFVADQSRTNYAMTLLSLAASMNMEYLDDMVAEAKATDTNPSGAAMFVNSKVLRFLHHAGYQSVSFSSGVGLQPLGTDAYLKPRSALSEFDNALINATPVRFVLNRFKQAYQHRAHRDRVLYILSSLGYLPKYDPPQFVFAHIVSPHPPFVFDAKGNPLAPDMAFTFADGSYYTDRASRESYVSGYRDQVAFLNTQLRHAIDRIVAADPTAVIILQGDHGPGSQLQWEDPDASNFWERMTILNAYRLPGHDANALLHTDISPVNSFRIVLNAYFEQSLVLLPDRSYFSKGSDAYTFIDVTDAASGPFVNPEGSG